VIVVPLGISYSLSLMAGYGLVDNNDGSCCDCCLFSSQKRPGCCVYGGEWECACLDAKRGVLREIAFGRGSCTRRIACCFCDTSDESLFLRFANWCSSIFGRP